MLRVEKIVYDAEYLEGLSRTQIQEHAKRHGIKANRKTETIVGELLGKKILEDELAAAVHAEQSSRPSQQKNGHDVKVGDVPKEELDATALEKALKAEAETRTSPSPQGTPDSASEGTPDLESEGTPSFSPMSDSPETPPQSSKPATTSKPAGDSRESSYCTHTESSSGMQETPPPAADQDPSVPKQTDHDVRVVRRHLTALFNEQASTRDEVDEAKALLAHTQGLLEACSSSIDYLSWRREAIERTVLVRYKCNRFLWDGVANMSDEDGMRWATFVNTAWTRHNKLQGIFKIPGNEENEDAHDQEYESADEEIKDGQGFAPPAEPVGNADDIYV